MSCAGWLGGGINKLCFNPAAVLLIGPMNSSSLDSHYSTAYQYSGDYSDLEKKVHKQSCCRTYLPAVDFNQTRAVFLTQLKEDYEKALAVDLPGSNVTIKVENNKPITDPPTVHNCS